MTTIIRLTSSTTIASSSELNAKFRKPSANSTKQIKTQKFDTNSPNEFTNDYYIRLSEIIIIVFILILWILSLRKFFKHFEKIRTTHYREIPYKYRLKDPENLSKVRVCRYPSQSVIFTNDPIAKVVNGRQFSMCDDLIMSPKTSLHRQMSPVYDEYDIRKKKFNIVISEVEDNNEENSEKSSQSNTNDKKEKDLYEDIEYIDNNINSTNSNEVLIKSNHTLQSCSLGNLNNSNAGKNLVSNTNKKLKRSKRQDDSSLDEQIYHRYFSSDQKRHLFRNSERNTTLSLQKKFYIDHLTVSPVIKKSIFDLHKRSLEKMSRNSSGNSNLNSPNLETKRNSCAYTNMSSRANKLSFKSSKMRNIRYSDCSSLSKKFSFYNQSSESFI